MTFYRSPSVFLNGCLHIMERFGQYSMILVVDMKGNTWRKIDRPSGLQHSMHQAQGHLCVCTIAGPIIPSFQSRYLKTMILIIRH